MVLIAVLLAAAASLGYGIGDVLAVTAVRRFTASSVALWAQSAGLLLLGLAAVVVRPDVSLAAVCWGLIAGALGATGVLAFYTAFQNGPTTVVAPLSSVGVVVPVLAGLVLDGALSVPGTVGVILLVAGVMIIAFARRGHAPQDDMVGLDLVGTPGRSQPAPVHDGCDRFAFRRPEVAAVLLSLLAAACFGAFLLVVQAATDAAAPLSQSRTENALMVAIAVQLGSLLVTALAASRHTVVCIRPNARLLGASVAIGLIDVVADVCLTYALAAGPVAVIGPIGSLDPVVAVVIAAFVLREPLGVRRIVGVVVSVIGVVLVAL